MKFLRGCIKIANTAIFYNTTTPKHYLKKDISNVIETLSCNIYNEQNIESVQLETTLFENYEKANYVKILNKYYFIKSKLREHNIIRFQLEEDVLFSILNKNLNHVSIIADRQENIYNNYINDDEMKGLAYTQVATIPFSNSLNQDTVILMTVG